MMKGFATDCTRRVELADWEELERYCYRVAGCVGLLALPIMGVEEDEGGAFARALGMALKLTNILRDLDEDMANKRFYIPQNLRERFDITADNWRRADIISLQAAAAPLSDKALDCFEQTRLLMPMTAQKNLLPALLMRDSYELLLRRMRRRGEYARKRKRMRLSVIDKARIAIKGVSYALRASMRR